MNALLEIIVSFGKIGFTALGGGHSMLKLIEYETVVARGWLPAEEFATIVGSTFLFPGLTAVKLSAIIGFKTAGILGLLLAVLSLNLPGLLMAVGGYTLLSSSDSPYAKKAMTVVQYGALAMLAAAAYSIAEGVIKAHFIPSLSLLTILFMLALIYLDVSPFWGLLAFIGVGIAITL